MIASWTFLWSLVSACTIVVWLCAEGAFGDDIHHLDEDEALRNTRDALSHHNVDGAAPSQQIGAFRIMPLGDSISICCNYCAVPAGVLVRKDLHEPPTPWDGYIRRLWHKLKAEELRQSSLLNADGGRGGGDFRFEYVGRVRSCMVNRSETMRVPDDWEIRYEGYYGYTTGRVLSEVVAPALEASDPDVVLLLLGTNDLIQLKSGGRLGRVGTAIQNLKALIELVLTTPRREGGHRAGQSRHVLIAKVPPIWFGQIKAVPPAARKPHRVAALNREIGKLVTTLVDAQRQRYAQLHGGGASIADGFIPTVSVVDMHTNFSVTEDLHGDGLHPNALGEDKISERWFHGLMPLMQNPVLFYNIPVAQNDDKLLQEALGRSTLTASIRNRKQSRPSGVASLHEPNLFGEQASSIWDRSLLPAVIFTLMAYAFLVCKPTQRFARQLYAVGLSYWNRTFGKGRPAPQ